VGEGPRKGWSAGHQVPRPRHSGLTWAAATGASTAELFRPAGHRSAPFMRELWATPALPCSNRDIVVEGPDHVQPRSGDPGSESRRAALTRWRGRVPRIGAPAGSGSPSGNAEARSSDRSGRSTKFLVSAPPLVRRLTGDPHGFGSCCHRPVVLDQPAEPESTFERQGSITEKGLPWRVGV
jgi:hypothetical protein